MSKKQYYIGIDIAAETFVASVYQDPSIAVTIHNDPFSNDPEGFDQCLQWLKTLSVTGANALVCMEATGVYGEALAYYLHAQGFSVAIEPPLKVKRAFDPTGHKTDAVDSKQISEYAYRFSDELVPWQPKHEILEKIRQLIATREQLTKQKMSFKCL
jgi:transposase